MAINHKYLSGRIVQHRKHKKLSQNSLSNIAGISREYLAQIETGKRHPSLDTVIKIANALEVSADDLLVDSLKYSSSTEGTDLHRLFLNCNDKEKQILLELIKYMKTVLCKLDI